VVQMWSKMLNKKKSNPFTISHMSNSLIGSILNNLCTIISNCKLVIFLHSSFALVCVGINHQKGGD
jgi:hypothetical protein